MKVGIIGGGASGMIAALSAASQGAFVTLIEHMPRIGKKLLLTGSGKCNISNIDMSLEHFHSHNPNFVSNIFAECSPEETLSFLENLGLYMKVRNGYYYPYSEQASGVLDTFRFALRDCGVNILTDENVADIKVSDNGFRIFTANNKYDFDRIIISCGSKSYSKTGSDGTGYQLAEKLGHTVIKPLPALTQLTCKEKMFNSLAGIRTKAGVKLVETSNGHILGSDTGELQLTKTGISGIPVFNISYLAAEELSKNNKISAVIDFMPDLSNDELIDLMKKRIIRYPDRILDEMFSGLLHKNIGFVILKKLGYELSGQVKNLEEKAIKKICSYVKNFECQIISTGDFENAQVVYGGVDTREIYNTLESKIVKNVYFTGEILDVSGDCGGYNLTWAFTSGILAGRNCVK